MTDFEERTKDNAQLIITPRGEGEKERADLSPIFNAGHGLRHDRYND